MVTISRAEYDELKLQNQWLLEQLGLAKKSSRAACWTLCLKVQPQKWQSTAFLKKNVPAIFAAKPWRISAKRCAGACRWNPPASGSLYRLEQEFNREGLKLSRQTIANWILNASDTWLRPIYDVLHRNLCHETVLHGDETTLQVLKEPGKAATSKSYMWLCRTSGCTRDPVVLYEDQPNRKAEHMSEKDLWPPPASAIAANFSIWRSPRNGIQNAWNKKNRFWMLCWHGQMRRSPKQHRNLRWVRRCITCWSSGSTWYAAWRTAGWSLSNNRVGRSIKPFVMGRKNWLFANTPAGAQSSAVIYSLIETAKENGLDPYRYLRWALRSAPALSQGDEAWAVKLSPANAPQKCYVPQ